MIMLALMVLGIGVLGTASATAADPIKIGITGPFTGSLAFNAGK
jgi:hypothetical protein